MKALEKQIKENKKQIVKLLNENIDLEDKINISGRYKEQEETHGRGKNKVTHLVGRKLWKERFTDESTGEHIFIERSCVVRIDGKPTDNLGNVIKRYTL